MAAGSFLLLILILAILVAIVVIGAVWVNARVQSRVPRALTRNERLQLTSDEELIDRIKELCYENRDSNLLGDIVIQEIKEHEFENRRKGITS